MNQKYLLFVTFCLLSLLSGNFSQAQNVFVGTRHSCVGDTVSVPIGIINGQGISAISLSLQAPPNTSLQFLGIDSLNTNLSAAQYSVNAANLFAFAWFNLNPVNFNGNLLYLKFKVLTPTVDSFRWDVNNSELADSSATPITSTSFTDGMFFSGVPSTPTYLTATLCQGQYYQVGNQFFGTSGLHSISLTNFAGCDSTVNLNLTIQPADTTRIERVLCPGENTTILGTSYNAPIVIHNNVPTAAGCDSIVEYRVEMMENTLTSTGSCVGSELTATTNAPDVIRATWRKNGQVVSNLVGGYGPNYSTIMGGQFSHATDVFFHEPTGDIYVAEAGAHRVVKITPGSTTPVLVAGGNGAGSTANQLSGPQGIFVSTNGTLFVADAGNHRVQRWLPGSTSGTTVAGGNGAGSLSRQLSAPFDVAVDAQGRIYVSDYNNHRIMRWNAGASSGSVYKSVNHPWGMQLMPNGDLYVAEHHGHLIRRFPANSTTSSVVAVNSTGGCHPTTFVINPMNEILVQWIHCSRQITRHVPDSTQGVRMFDIPHDGYGMALDGSGSLLVGQHHGWDMLRRYNQNTLDTLRLVSNNEGAYTLDLVRRGGCVSVSNAVTVYGVESEVHSDKGALICNGDTATLSVTQQSGYTYQWLKNGLDIPGAISAQIQVVEPGTYMLRSTESHGCQALSEPFVVASPSVTTIQSSGQCVGDSVYFSSSDSTITQVRFYTNGNLTQTLFAGLDEGEVVANGFNVASGLACDAQGNMYISDYHPQRVVKWNLNSTSGSNIAAGHGSALNQVNYPTGLFAAQNGDVYLADHANHRVIRYSLGNGSGIVVAGGNGQGGGLSQLNHPVAVWVKGNGDVMVADRDNHRIVRWSPGATQGVIVAGTGIAGNTANQLNAPSELFIKDDGTMYVSDRSNHRVQRFSPGSMIAQTVAGGNGQGSTLAHLSGPIGILVDGGNNLFVADYSNNRIVVWPQGSSSGIELANSSLVVSPHSLAFAPDGSLLVTEFAHPLGVKRFRLRYLNSFAVAAPQNGVVTATALNRNSCILPVGGSVNISSPEFELLSSKGDLLCEGDTSILSVQTSDTFAYQWYRDGQAIAGETGQQLSVSQPAQYWVVATNTSGCSTSSRMYRVNNIPTVSISTNGACGNNAQLTASVLDSSAVAMTWMKNGQAVGYKGVRYEPIGDAWNSTFLPPWDWYAHPIDVVIDPKGEYLYYTSRNNVYRYRLGGGQHTLMAGGGPAGSALGQLSNPGYMVFDKMGRLYLSDWGNHRVLRYDFSSTVALPVVVAGGNGLGHDSSRLYHPAGLYVDDALNIYVVDNHNHRIQRWVAGASSGVTIAGGNGQGPGLNQLSHPSGLKFDEQGNIFVSDQHNHRVMRWSPGSTSGVVVAGGNGAGASMNQLTYPTDLELDKAGGLIVADHHGHRIIRVAPTSNIGEVIAGGNGVGGSSLQLYHPHGVALDQAGRLYVTDNHNHRIMRYFHYGIDSSVYRPARGGDYQARVYYRNGCYSESNSVHVGNIDTTVLGGPTPVVLCQGQSLQVGQQSISTPGYHEVLLTNAAGCDSLVQAFVVVKPVSQTNLVATICQGQSYTFGNQILMTAGNYTMNLSNHLDCDSLVTLTLIIQTPIVEHISTSVCSPAVYSFGSLNLTQSGQYVHTFASHAGCDSTVHLNLTVLHPSTFTMAESICQGQTFSFGTQTLTQTGNYTQNLSGVNGCDSLVVLNLNVKPTYSINLTERICSGSTYTFGSQQLSSSGLYTLSLSTHQGCDSIVQLNLLVGSPPPPTVLNEVVCYPSTYTVGNQSFGSSGQYTVVLDDVSGCDSTVVLNLEVRNPSAHTITMTTVGAQFVMVGNQHFNQTGTHIVHLVNAQGCDSVVTLHLTAVPIVVRASNLTTCDGDTILVPLILENAMGISAMSLTLNYPGQNLRYLGYQQVNPTLSQANLLLNATIVNGVNQVRIAWYDLVPVNISSGNLLSLRFVVEQASFSSLEWDLNNFGMCEFADEFGDSVRNMVYHNGLIHSGGSQSTISATICQGQSYFFDGSARSTTGVYTSNYPDHLGCDSIVVLNLNVNPTSSVTIYDTIPILSTYWVSNQSFTHTGVYQVLLSNQYGCDSVVTLHLKVLGYPLNGRLQYNNSNFPGNSTPMTNTTVNLRVGGQIVKSAQTNSLGQFTFGPVDSNTYELSYSHNKPWGGVNATDALTISRHFTNVIPLTGFRLTAGDVNLSSVVNTSDALLITRRYSNLLSSFPSGNWAYSLNSFHIGPRENLYLDIKSLCYGDVNGSYNPSVNARLAWKNVGELNQVVTQTKAYHLDIKAADDFNLGAASMTLRLPNGVKVESVTALCAASQEPVIFKQEGQILRIAWYHLATWNVRNGDGIFRLGLQGLGEGNLEIEEISSELATENATPIDGLPIAAPRLINKSLEKAPSVVYPNPSSDHATLEFTLGSKAPVDIQIMDAIGKVVWERLGGDFDQGVHRINLPMVDLAQGVYYVILRKEIEAGRVSREAIRIQKVR